MSNNIVINQKIKNFEKKEKKKFQFISNVNYKVILFDLFYRFSENAFFSKVFISNLKDYYFENKNGNNLLFFHKDLKNQEDKNCKRTDMTIKNLNNYVKKMKIHNTKFILLISPDKFYIYRNFLNEKKNTVIKFLNA